MGAELQCSKNSKKTSTAKKERAEQKVLENEVGEVYNVYNAWQLIPRAQNVSNVTGGRWRFWSRGMTRLHLYFTTDSSDCCVGNGLRGWC